MSLTRAQLVTLCENRFQDPSHNIYTAADWQMYLGFAEADVYAGSPWWPMDEAKATNTITVASGGEVTLPTDCYRLNSVYNVSDDFPIPFLSGRMNSQTSPSDTGVPFYYQLRNNVLVIFPKPDRDTDISITYMVAPPLMAADGDIPNFPSTYHRMLVFGALGYAYEDDNNLTMSAPNKARFDAMLERLKDDMLNSRSESYTQIQDDWDTSW